MSDFIYIGKEQPKESETGFKYSIFHRQGNDKTWRYVSGASIDFIIGYAEGVIGCTFDRCRIRNGVPPKLTNDLNVKVTPIASDELEASASYADSLLQTHAELWDNL